MTCMWVNVRIYVVCVKDLGLEIALHVMSTRHLIRGHVPVPPHGLALTATSILAHAGIHVPHALDHSLLNVCHAL